MDYWNIFIISSIFTLGSVIQKPYSYNYWHQYGKFLFHIMENEKEKTCGKRLLRFYFTPLKYLFLSITILNDRCKNMFLSLLIASKDDHGKIKVHRKLQMIVWYGSLVQRRQ